MSKEMLKNLLEERANVYEKAKDALERAEKAGAEDNADAMSSWDGHMEQMRKLDDRIAEVRDLEERNRRADEARDQLKVEPPKPEDKKEPSDADLIRSMVNGERRAVEFRDLVKSTSDTPKAGYTVPTSFYGQLQEHMIETAALRQTNVTVLTTDSGEDLQVPKTTTHPTAAIIGEGSSITESDPVFGQVTLQAWKYAFSLQLSTELETDTGVDLVGYLARAAGRALGNGCGADFVAGNGSSKPNGLTNTATTGVTGGTGVTGAFTVNDIIDLYYSVIAPYRKNATWLMADAAIKAARKLKDATSGFYLWNNSVLADEPSTLLGRPVVNDTNVPDPALSAKSVLFGDMSAYFIRDVRGVRAERSTDFAFQNDLVTWRFILRTDGDLIDTTGAVKCFVGGAT